MARRRLYVFGGIILLGVLLGIFCLPDSGDPEAKNRADARTAEAVFDSRPPLPPGNIENTPGVRAETLVKKARVLSNAAEKLVCLKEAYRIDPTGRWGGEAAAEMGHLWKKAGNMAEARKCYLAARQALVSRETLARVNAELQAMQKDATAPALSRVKTLTYKAQPGDSLWKISRRYATTIEAIKKANKLSGDMIRIGKLLKVPKGPFDVLVTKHLHTLQLLQDGKPVKVYTVGLGRDDSTPAGSFVVSSKLVDPVWYSNDLGRIPPGDPRNVLSSRWIGFNDQIGIHGTRKQDEHTVGKDVSEGCIRMRDADVKELYDFVVEAKSKVTIAD